MKRTSTVLLLAIGSKSAESRSVACYERTLEFWKLVTAPFSCQLNQTAAACQLQKEPNWWHSRFAILSLKLGCCDYDDRRPYLLGEQPALHDMCQ